MSGNQQGYPGCDLRQSANQNGATMCYTNECRKHANLNCRCGGHFCGRHVVELEEVRERIDSIKLIPPPERTAWVIHCELNARVREKEFRGGTDVIHQQIIDDLILELNNR